MPVKIPREATYSESGRKQTGLCGYNMHDALALMRLLLRWRHGGYKPMLVRGDQTLVSPRTLRQYIYQSKMYINENPGTFTKEIRDLKDKFAVRLDEKGLWIALPPRAVLNAAVDTAVTVSKVRGADYSGRQLFVQWVSTEHETGEYVDIPGQFSIADKEFFDQMANDYKDIITVEFAPENVRVIWHAENKGGENESPW